ncbi:uncharacterized protein LOC129808265 [Phlebotomus papatasi]|uniref:uncharacterized protein LOC129808265 n=1 Tax=Phlebotomus papatasi TaxID=29031 RepID=UPI0024844403|nr:uncharacterized protein LOC129808265 [Phlebotomus papatasi]
MDSVLGCEYDSEVTGDHGFEFQEELLLHVCLRMVEMECQSFSVGLEVKKFPKFDDVVVDFDHNGRKYLIFLQAKHVMNQKKKILSDHFYCGVENDIETKTTRDLWKNFNLRQYLNAAMNETFQVSLLHAQDHLLRYIVLTNLVYVDDDDTVEEDNEDVQELFAVLSDRGAEIFKFGDKSSANIQKLIDLILKNSKEKVLDLGLKYFQDRMTIVSRSPNLDKLAAINDKMLSKNYKVFNVESFRKIFRKNLFEFTAIDPEKRSRKTLGRDSWEKILCKTIIEVDFPPISETFIQDLPDWAEFTDETLTNLLEEVRKCHKIVCDGSVKLAILKVHGALRKEMEDLLVVPASKISKLQFSALKTYDKKLILYLDDAGKFTEEITDNDCIIFIVKKWEEEQADNVLRINLCRFEEFTEASKDKFMDKKIDFQGYSIPLSSIPIYHDDSYSSFMSDVLERLAEGEQVQMGKELPRDKIPSIYLERWPFTSQNHTDMFFKRDKDDFSRVRSKGMTYIVTGGPGMGKSCGLQNAAIFFKEKFSYFWVDFFDLKRYSKVFFERKSSSFTEEEAVNFVLDKLATYGPNRTLENKLLRIYVNDLSSPSIFLFFDGFDEISPTYETLVLNLIHKLSKRNFKCFITSRLHCKYILQGPGRPDPSYVTSINPYKTEEIERFTWEYWKWKLPNMVHLERILEFQEKFLQYFEEFTAILQTPILLRMLADITTRDCERYCENPGNRFLMKFENVDTWTIYGIIFEMSFDGFYEKEGIDHTSNFAIAKRKQDIEIIRKIHKYLAVVELNLTHIIEIEADISKDVEILARGFITRSDNGDFFYVHRTYAEYFCAECIFEELEQYNKTVLEYLAQQHPDTVINDFVYRFLMEKIKTNYAFISRDRLFSLDPEGNIFNYLLKFCDFFLLHVWRHKIKEVNNAVKFIENIFNPEEIQNFNFDEYYNLLDNGYLFIKPPQVVFVVRYSIRIFGDCEKASILQKADAFVKKKIGGSDADFLEEYYNSLITENVLTENEVVQECHQALKKYVMSTWHRTKFFFLYFKLKRIDYADEFSDFKDWIQNRLLTEFDTHYIRHVVLMEEEFNKSHDYIDNIARYLVQEDIMYEFLRRYDLDHHSRTDFVGRIVAAFSNLGLKFICADNNSILYYFWVNKKDYLMKDFLAVLKPHEIEELTTSPHFNGRSLLEHFHSDENADYVNEAFITYIFRTFNEETLFQYLTPLSHCSESDNIPLSIGRDLNLCLALGNQIESDEDEKSNIIEKLLLRILEDKFSWKSRTGNKIFFLHTVVGFKFKYRTKKAADFIYNWLKSNKPEEQSNVDRYLMSELNDFDEDGNSVLHIAASKINSNFFKFLFKTIENETLIRLMTLQNSKNQNFMHCCSTNKTMDEINFYMALRECIEKKNEEITACIEELLLQQDTFKRTPFHNQSEEFFLRHIRFVSKEKRYLIFCLEDENKDTLLHKLPQICSKSYFFSDLDILITHLNSINTDLLKKLLQNPNNEGLSPLDISNTVKNERLIKIYEDFINMD